MQCNLATEHTEQNLAAFITFWIQIHNLVMYRRVCVCLCVCVCVCVFEAAHVLFIQVHV